MGVFLSMALLLRVARRSSLPLAQRYLRSQSEKGPLWTVPRWFRSVTDAEVQQNYLEGLNHMEEGDTMLAWKKFKLAAEAKHPHSMFMVAGMLSDEKLSEPDYQTAASLYYQAGEAGYVEGYQELADLLVRGKVSRMNALAEAESLLRKAVDGGSSSAQKQLDSVLQTREAFGRVIEDIQLRADQGDESGLLMLALLLYTGQGLPEDKERALKLYLQAAELGNLTAMETITLFYLQGDQVPGMTDAKAMELLQKGLTGGYVRCTANLGMFYALGRGVKKDLARAMQLWEQGGTDIADRDDCQEHMAACYYAGDGVAKNIPRAVEIWRAGAARKLPHFQHRLAEAIINRNATGTREEVFILLQDALSAGYAPALDTYEGLQHWIKDPNFSKVFKESIQTFRDQLNSKE